MNKYEAKIRELETKISLQDSQIRYLTAQNEQLQSNFNRLLQINKQLIAENKQLKQELKAKDEEIIRLKAKISQLESELEKHKVHTNKPPSQTPDYEKENKEEPKSKGGQKKGHKGVSRKNPTKIHKKVHYFVTSCECCGSTNLSHKKKKRRRLISELLFKVINILETFQDSICNDCGYLNRARSEHGDSNSPYGKNAQSLMTYLKSSAGMTTRLAENLFKDFFKFSVSDSTICNTQIRISQIPQVEEKYNGYLEKIRNADYSHKDESTWRVGGVTYWCWVYVSKDTVFYRIADSRKKSVVEKDFEGREDQLSINDGYAGYNFFKVQQQCWAHLTRKTEGHAKKENATEEEIKFHKDFSDIFHRAKVFIAEDPPYEKRCEERAKFENELVDTMIQVKKKTDFLETLFNFVSLHLDQMFVFVEIPGIEPTNNIAEQHVRPLVIHRKISFGSKSDEGAEALMRLKTVYENAKKMRIASSNAFRFIFRIPKNCGVITIPTT